MMIVRVNIITFNTLYMYTYTFLFIKEAKFGFG